MLSSINWGPLSSLVQNSHVSEIIVNSYNQIFFETKGESDFRWLDRTAAEFLGIELGGKHKICCGLEYVNWLKEKLGIEWNQIMEMLQRCENKDEYWNKFEMILYVSK
jgi:hypothetical protein